VNKEKPVFDDGATYDRLMAGVMRVECAWCKKVMREGDPAIVSHGICPECAKIAKAAKTSTADSRRGHVNLDADPIGPIASLMDAKDHEEEEE
jgi:hypothetical protein